MDGLIRKHLIENLNIEQDDSHTMPIFINKAVISSVNQDFDNQLGYLLVN